MSGPPSRNYVRNPVRQSVRQRERQDPETFSGGGAVVNSTSGFTFFGVKGLQLAFLILVLEASYHPYFTVTVSTKMIMIINVTEYFNLAHFDDGASQGFIVPQLLWVVLGIGLYPAGYRLT